MVSIITINYNRWQDTCELIASLKQFEDYPYEVIVVDNASHGDDADRIHMAHPEVILIRSNINLGFAGGNNLGYKHSRGEYIFFLNNDMIVKSPILHPLVQRLSDPDIGGTSPCIKYYYKPNLLQYYGYQDMTSITLKHKTLPYDYSRSEDFLKPEVTEVLHGGAMMVSRTVIEQVGQMTEVYFLFYEEFDWSRRMREAGYKLFYEPASVVYHKESASIPPATPFREYYLSRSRIIYAKRNCKGWYCWISQAYLLFLAFPKKILSNLLSQRYDLCKAIFFGVCSGLKYKNL